MQTKSISQQIASFALEMRYEDIPQNVLEFGKMLLLDTFGVALSCQRLPHMKAVRSTVETLGGTEQSTLWGLGEKNSLANAVLYNSALIHGADYDDTHVAGILHPSAAVVSTAVTVGEFTGASGREVMGAIVMGWEVITRLALAAKGRFHDVGYHGTAIVAPFAAACVAARLMGDSQETLVNALGICGSQAAGLQAFLADGSWVKKIHPGWGAHSAVYAVLLARQGFTGPVRVFEDRFGLWMTHLGATDGLEEQMQDLGKVWHTPEITFKMYPVCHMTHSFIDCMLALQKEHGFTAADIRGIECRIEERCYQIVCEPHDAKARPTTDYIMRISLPYVMALAAVRGRVSPREIDLNCARDPEILAMIDRITCVSDDSKRNPGCFPGWIKVDLQDGRSLIKEQRFELGKPENPVQTENVKVKFHHNADPFYDEEMIEKMEGQILRFETLKGMPELIYTFEKVRENAV